MHSIRSLTRSLLRRDIHIHPCAVGPGDYLILSIPHLPADIDIVSLLGAAQDQFPGVRIQLLAGFPGVEVLRQQDSAKRSGGGDSGRPNPGDESPARATVVISPSAIAGQQRPVVVLRHCFGDRIIATTIPPEEEGDSIEQVHPSCPPLPARLSPEHSRQVHQLAADILAACRPDLAANDDAQRLRRLLARKMHRAAVKFLAHRQEPTHA